MDAAAAFAALHLVSANPTPSGVLVAHYESAEPTK